MIQCSECRRGYLTLVRSVIEHQGGGKTTLHVVACDSCGLRASLRDSADYYRERALKGPNLFEEKQ